MPDRIRQTRQPTINVPTALAAINNVQTAVRSNDPLKYVIALKQLEMHAEEFEFKKSQANITNIAKIIDQQTELGKLITEQAMDDEIRKANKSGDMERVDFLLALKSGRQRPTNIQSLDKFRSMEFDTESERQTALGFLDPNYQPSEFDELSVLQEQGLISPEQQRTAVGRSVTDATSQEKNAQLISSWVDQGIVTESEGKELYQSLFLKSSNEPSTDTEVARKIMVAFPKGDPTASALNKINIAYPNANANKIVSYIGRLTEDENGNQRSFSEMKDAYENPKASDLTRARLPDDTVIQAADEFKTAAELKIGDESVRKVMQAREVLQTEIPVLIDMMESYENENGKGSLGLALRIENGVLKRARGYPSSPELDEIFTTTQDMIANVLLIRSGATVTDEERNIMNAMVPNAVVPLRFSRARGIALLNANKRAASKFYDRSINPAYSKVIVDRYYTAELTRVRELQDADPEVTKLPSGVSENQVTEIMERTGLTRKEVVDAIKARGQ